MNRLTRAYLFQGGTVVIDKNLIRNAKDEDFTEVSLILSKDQIKQFHNELEAMGELDEETD
jgi:hypothetical protein